MWVSIRKNVGLGKSRAIFIKEFSIMGRSAGGGMEKVSIITMGISASEKRINKGG